MTTEKNSEEGSTEEIDVQPLEPSAADEHIGDAEHGEVRYVGVSFCHKHCYILRNSAGRALWLGKYAEKPSNETVLLDANMYRPPVVEDPHGGYRFSQDADPGNIVGMGFGARRR